MARIGFSRVICRVTIVAILGVVAHTDETCACVSGMKNKQAVATSRDFQVRIKMDRTTVARGDQIVLKIELKNVSKQPLAVKDTIARRDFELDVRSDSGKHAALTDKGRQMKELDAKWEQISAKFHKIRPGEKVEYTLDISGLYEFKPGSIHSITVYRSIASDSGQPRRETVSNTIRLTMAQ